MDRLADIESIAVLRANGIGDMVFALPALEALRQAYPSARISLLASPWHEALFRDRPAPFNEVIVVPPSQGVREQPGVTTEPEELEAFFEEMRARNFDLTVQMHGGGRYSNPFLLSLGGRVSAGMRAPGAPRLDIELPYVYYQHEVLRLLELVSLLGAPLVRPEPRLAITPADRAAAAALLPADDRPLVVLNPGAGDPRRRWPADKFAQLGDRLVREGAAVVVTGSEADRPLGERISADMSEACLDLTGKLELGTLLGILSCADLMVSNDSGPLHMGAAVGAATVGLFWCGNQINAGLPFRARHRPVISWRLECPVCGVDCTKGSCDHDASFVADISVDEVSERAFELLAEDGERRGSSRAA